MIFNLRPYKRTKNNTLNDWVYEYKPYGRVSKLEVVKRILSMYPDLQIQKVHVIKSLKRILVVLTTNKPYPVT